MNSRALTAAMFVAVVVICQPFAAVAQSTCSPDACMPEMSCDMGMSCGCCAQACCCPGFRCANDITGTALNSKPFRWFQTNCLARRKITVGGWVDQGVSFADCRPSDRFNGPVTYNDRDREYQMNQLWFFLERKTNTRCGGFDIGGRIDTLFGSDARFIESSDGLEANWHQDQRFYGGAVPQFYVDAAYNRVTVRTGHFLSPLSYEDVRAPKNFFYSHSYTRQYAEPTTFTGLLGMFDLSDRLRLSSGFHRGWNKFDDTDGNDRINVLAMAEWTSWDCMRQFKFGFSSGEEEPGNNTTLYTLIGKLCFSPLLNYAVQFDYGQSTGGLTQRVRYAEWTSLVQYFNYKYSNNWALGTRIEWFRDKQGTRVHGLGIGNMAYGSYPGDFFEISLGLNWQPSRNVMIRPEVRWDWFDKHGHGDSYPYDAGGRRNQFMGACDLIVSF
ncbi:MAG: porin [Pirellulales bacterium]|nr:porin [Pirellulales bacterium]